MLSELGRQIAEHVDTTAAPIDVDSLIRGLTAAAPPGRSPRPVRDRALAFAGALSVAVVTIGGAIALLWWVGRTRPGPVGGTEPADPGLTADSSLWWLVVIAAAAVVIALAEVARRSRTTPRTKEDTMQTLERVDPVVEERDQRIATLERHRRLLAWLAAVVLLAGAVVVTWPTSESSELTDRQQAMADVMDEYWRAGNEGDFETMRALFTPSASIEETTLVFDVDGWIGNLEFWHSSGTDGVVIPGDILIGGKFVVQRIVEEWPTVAHDALVVAEFDRNSNRIMRLSIWADAP